MKDNQPDPQNLEGGPMVTSIPLRFNIVSEIIANDHLKSMLNKSTNKGVYHPYVSKLVPKAKHSPFGDFPKELMTKKSKEEDFAIDVHENSQAGTSSNAFPSKGLGTGGKCSSKLKPKAKRGMVPPKAGSLMRRAIPPTNFRREYDVGNLPVHLNHGHEGGKLQWKTKPSQLNYNLYLPLFFEGLREKQDPYRFIAVQGTFDLLDEGEANIGKVIPQLIIPIKGNNRCITLSCS
eukprot:TRINITY_DN941_c0_g1_i3.p1 TRINITY_DN941_c0_g1~~TRINITY_DN941_c0_g1_i3.p1  ORF type:complete len:234 (-),score=48.93 TRINITY_DN941_c0_g1_i3:293-994(-)